ncbi:MAG: elongation factor 1-beta [Candidatus Pacearchaeota archaeon]|nr:elongation factor 1-beta [Candidatus Pacearchaeota archaeon]
MSIAVLKLKIMPESSDTNLDAIKTEVEKRLTKFKAKLHSSEQEPVAFGIKALIVTIAWPEKESTDSAVEELLHISGVSSIDIIDYRRAFG